MLAPRTDFIGIEDVVHLAAGGETPLLRQHLATVERFARHKGGGMAGREAFFAVRAALQQRIAGWLGLTPGDIACVGSASEGIARVIAAYDWRPGDSVVVAASEFPSGVFGLARLRALGVDCRIIAPRGCRVETADLLAACDGSTRLVYASHVSYLTGQRLDLAALIAGVHAAGAAILLDVTHSLGVVPVPAGDADFVVASGYKWLLGTHMGVFGWNRRRQPDFAPFQVGWRSGHATGDAAIYRLWDDATRAEAGNPNHLDVYLLEGATAYLAAIGIERIAAYVAGQATRLRAGLVAAGLPVITPEPSAERAGNVCFAHADGEAVARRAAAAGVLLWGGDGRVRLSVHCYVTPDDIDRALAVLPAVV